MYSIKQLADRYHVSKQAISKELKKEKYQPSLSRGKNNMILVDENVLPTLDQHFRQSTTNHSDTDLIKHQQDMITTLKQEIDRLHVELQHEQELHLADQQKLKVLTNSDNVGTKRWWQFWK